MREKYQSNIRKYYLASFLGGVAFFYNSIDTLYYKHFNLSFNQVGLLLAIALVVTLILEIPTGVFADIYGKKTSIVIGSLCNLIGIAFLAFGTNFSNFIYGFIFWGASNAFQSGAGNAFLYDSLVYLDLEQEYLKHTGRLSALFTSLDIASGFLGPLLFTLSVRLPYYISLLAAGLALMLQISLFEIKPKITSLNGISLKIYFKQTAQSLSSFFKSKSIILLSIFGFVFFVSNKVYSEMMNGPLLQSFNFSLTDIGFIGLIGASFQTIIAFFTNNIEERLGKRNSMTVSILGITLTLLSYIYSRNVITTGMLMGLYWGAISFSSLVFENYLNQLIRDDSKRATMLSINSMFNTLLSLMLLPFVGLYIDKTSMVNGIYLIVVFIFFGGFISMYGLIHTLRQTNTNLSSE